MTTLKALIIAEKDRGESSKSITVVTAEKGVIDVFVRGGRKSTKTSSGTQLFSYSEICLDEKRNSRGITDYYLNSCQSIRIFYNIRLDAKKTALAAYFAELLLYCRVESGGCDEVMRLALNTFYFLNEGEKDMELLKSVFEFRLLCEIGLMPDLIGCHSCLKYEDDKMYFSFKEHNLTCSDCYCGEDGDCGFDMDRTLLYIVRFIALTEFERLFSFKISEKYQLKLTEFTENYVGYNFKRNFPALEFYKII